MTVSYFKRATENQPNHPVYLYNLAILLHLVRLSDADWRCAQTARSAAHRPYGARAVGRRQGKVMDRRGLSAQVQNKYEEAAQVYTQCLSIEHGPYHTYGARSAQPAL